MKQIYWLSIGALVMAVVAGILFLVLSLGTLSSLKEVNKTNPETSTLTASTNVEVTSPCDMEALLSQAQGLFEDAIGDVPDSWTLEVRAGSTTSRELYGWVEGESINPCEYALEYSMPRNTDEELKVWSDADDKVRDFLLKNGWSNMPIQEIKIGGQETSLSVSLGHADGPMMQVEVFATSGDADGVLQFAKIEHAQRWTNRKDYMDGLREDPCPCTGSLRLSVTAPVKLEELIPQ